MPRPISKIAPEWWDYTTLEPELLADAAQARDLAGEANDPESQDLMIQRITLHQKTVWMLQSFLKG